MAENKMKVFIVLSSLIGCIMAQPVDIPAKIVGGVRASPGEFPFQVSFQYFGRHMCGGSIVSRRHVVTAAHCCVHGNQLTRNYGVAAGEHRLSMREGTEQVVNIDQITIHPEYDDHTLDNDICVLTLSAQLDFASPFVRPIELAAITDQPQGNAVVVGWGHQREGGIPSDVLRKVTVPIISNAECQRQYPGEIIDSMICAGRPTGGVDSCQGDSGGALTAFTNGRNKLVGVVSWGTGCARPGLAGVYTRVSNFNAWVNSIIQRL